MGLSNELKNFNVPSFCKIPKNINSCLVLGNLYGKLDTLKDIKTFSLLSPLEIKDERVEFFGKYEVGSEEGVLALLLQFCTKKSDEKLENFLDDLDIGYISAECNIGEEEAKELASILTKGSFLVVVCEDLEFHKNAKNIAKLLSMLAFYGECDIVYERLKEDIKGDLPTIADEIEELESFDGAVVYFTKEADGLLGSRQFAQSNRLQNGDMVLVKTKDSQRQREFKIAEELKGTIGLLFDKSEKSSYAYEVSKISRIEDE